MINIRVGYSGGFKCAGEFLDGIDDVVNGRGLMNIKRFHRLKRDKEVIGQAQLDVAYHEILRRGAYVALDNVDQDAPGGMEALECAGVAGGRKYAPGLDAVLLS